MSELLDIDLDNIETMARVARFSHPADVLKLVAEVRRLRALTQGLAARVAAQSDLLSRRAEKTPC